MTTEVKERVELYLYSPLCASYGMLKGDLCLYVKLANTTVLEKMGGHCRIYEIATIIFSFLYNDVC